MGFPDPLWNSTNSSAQPVISHSETISPEMTGLNKLLNGIDQLSQLGILGGAWVSIAFPQTFSPAN
jgi:hypothetical protein